MKPLAGFYTAAATTALIAIHLIAPFTSVLFFFFSLFLFGPARAFQIIPVLSLKMFSQGLSLEWWNFVNDLWRFVRAVCATWRRRTSRPLGGNSVKPNTAKRAIYSRVFANPFSHLKCRSWEAATKSLVPPSSKPLRLVNFAKTCAMFRNVRCDLKPQCLWASLQIFAQPICLNLQPSGDFSLIISSSAPGFTWQATPAPVCCWRHQTFRFSLLHTSYIVTSRVVQRPLGWTRGKKKRSWGWTTNLKDDAAGDEQGRYF